MVLILYFVSGFFFFIHTRPPQSFSDSTPFSIHDQYYSTVVDSLSQYIKDSTTATEAAILCDIGSKNYRNFNFEDGIRHARRALETGRQVGDTVVIIRALRLLADNYYGMGQYEQSTAYFEEELGFHTGAGDHLKIAEVYCNIGVNFEERGLLEEGMFYYLEALKAYEMFDDKEGIVASLCNLSFVYKSLKRFPEAIESLEKARQMEKQYLDAELRKEHYYMVYIGESYMHLGEFDRALEYLTEGEELLEEIKVPDDEDLILWVELLKIQGDIHAKRGNADEAYNRYIEALDLSRMISYLEKQGKVLVSLGNMMLERGKHHQAKVYLTEGAGIAEQIGSLYLKKEVYDLLSRAAFEQNEFREAFEYLRIFTEVSDSVLNLESARQLANFQVSYETEKKENQIQLLEKEKRIQDLQLQKSASQRAYLIIFSVLLLSLLIVILNRFRLKRQVASELTVLNATKDKFFTIIAHDLKNPLSAFNQITRQIDTHFDSIDPRDLKAYIASLSENSSSLLELLKNLLAWSKSQRGQLVPGLEDVDAKEIAEKLASEAGKQAGMKNSELILLPLTPVSMYTDRYVVETVLRNVLDNAIKFSPEGSRITLAAGTNDTEVVFTVTDQGPGLSEEDIGKLFRIEVDTLTIGGSKNKGTGIGLLVCHEFLNKAGGRIWVESEPGEGCVFSVAIPLSKNN